MSGKLFSLTPNETLSSTSVLWFWEFDIYDLFMTSKVFGDKDLVLLRRTIHSGDASPPPRKAFSQLLYWDSGSLHSSASRSAWETNEMTDAALWLWRQVNSIFTETMSLAFLNGNAPAESWASGVVFAARAAAAKRAQIKSRGLNSASVVTGKIDDLLNTTL